MIITFTPAEIGASDKILLFNTFPFNVDIKIREYFRPRTQNVWSLIKSYQFNKHYLS